MTTWRGLKLQRAHGYEAWAGAPHGIWAVTRYLPGDCMNAALRDVADTCCLIQVVLVGVDPVVALDVLVAAAYEVCKLNPSIRADYDYWSVEDIREALRDLAPTKGALRM